MTLEIASFGAAPTDALLQLTRDPQVQQALERSGVKGKVNELLAKYGGDVRGLLAKANVNINQIASQAGLPPELGGAIFKIGGFLKAKGVEGKLKAGADAAQSIIDQSSGVYGQVGAAATNLLTKAVRLKLHAAGKVGGTAGSGVGMAILGPAGAAAGRVVGTFVGEGVRAVGKTLGIEGAAAKRKDREKNREGDDAKRALLFFQAYPDARASTAKLYEYFRRGQVVMSHGVIGSQKPEERNDFGVVNGVFKERLSPDEQRQKWAHVLGKKGSTGPWVLYLTSNKWTEQVGGPLLEYEQKQAAEREKQQQAARAQLQRVKSALVAGLTQAATARGAAPARGQPPRATGRQRRPLPPLPAAVAAGVVKPRRHRRPAPAAAPAPAVASGAPGLVEPSYEQLVKFLLG